MAALADGTPARLFYGVGNVGFWLVIDCTKGGHSGSKTSAPVLVAKTPDGKVLAIWATYACHCVTLSDNKISGDWAGLRTNAHSTRSSRYYRDGLGLDAAPWCLSLLGVTGDKGRNRAEAQGTRDCSERLKRLLGQYGLVPPLRARFVPHFSG